MKYETVPLTLILPVHDLPARAASLTRALESVASQRIRPAEVIVVDDGSFTQPDIGSALSYDLNVRVLTHDQNRGPAAARNTGMRAAQTEWVSFLDSDDVLLGSSIANRWHLLHDRLTRDDARRIVFGCGWLDVGVDGQPLGLRWPRPARSALDFASGCWFSPGSCVILNCAEAIKAAGFQDENLRRLEDVDWFLALGLNGFVLEVLPVAAVAIERKRSERVAEVDGAANAIRSKWRNVLNPAVFRHLDSYLDVEIAAAHWFGGSKGPALRRLLKSLAKVPRASLQLSPGWDRELVNGASPQESFSRSLVR